MVSFKKKSTENLNRMVKGAAREAAFARKSDRPDAPPPAKAVVSESKPAPAPAPSPKKEAEKVVGLADNVVAVLKEQLAKNGRSLQSIPVNLIELGENIRTIYGAEELKKLEDSLKSDGLIQMPTICLKEKNGVYAFVCKNGHRRVLAAKNLGWEKIECIVRPFDSVRDELYHMINANMREDVFYLDLARAYEQGADLGESDNDIGARVGVNPRTVRWYRRLSKFSPGCEALVRSHPDLFNATWAINLARKGELPESSVLELNMSMMVKVGRTWIEMRKPDAERQGAEAGSNVRVEKARHNLSRMFSGKNGDHNAMWARNFLAQLVDAGYLPKKYMITIGKEVIHASGTESDEPVARSVPEKNLVRR
jgi:ParB-like chromosome segregation protein Spo0J